MNRSINVIGTGNVGKHLVQAFRSVSPEHRIEVRCISSRTLENIDTEAMLTVIAVSDSAIEEVASRLPDISGIVAHTSGATPLSVIAGKFKHPAVFYPLQSLSASKAVDYRDLPILIEATDETDFKILEEFAGKFTNLVARADSDTRSHLHIAAVFANNFVNHMIAQAESILEREGLDKDFLQPLIHETFSKITVMSARDAQTGPAVRGDRNTIENHKMNLSYDPDLVKLYDTISGSIIKMHHK